MSKKDEALKLALDAICGSGEFLFNWHDCEPNNEREIQQYQAVLAANEKAFTALRRALEQPAQQEPVAVYVGETWCGSVVRLYEDLPLETPLYTRSQSMTPLTDEQIYDMYNEPRSDAEMLEFARAIEAAHGIGEKK